MQQQVGGPCLAWIHDGEMALRVLGKLRPAISFMPETTNPKVELTCLQGWRIWNDWRGR